MVKQPLSITMFAFLSIFSVTIAATVAIYAAQSFTFGFEITPEAAHKFAGRIVSIRIAGIGLAVALVLGVVFGRSRVARGSLGARWMMGAVTSIPFLRGIGVLAALPGNESALFWLSAIQLTADGLAILVLYSDDAREWFERRPAYTY